MEQRQKHRLTQRTSTRRARQDPLGPWPVLIDELYSSTGALSAKSSEKSVFELCGTLLELRNGLLSLSHGRRREVRSLCAWQLRTGSGGHADSCAEI